VNKSRKANLEEEWQKEMSSLNIESDVAECSRRLCQKLEKPVCRWQRGGMVVLLVGWRWKLTGVTLPTLIWSGLTGQSFQNFSRPGRAPKSELFKIAGAGFIIAWMPPKKQHYYTQFSHIMNIIRKYVLCITFSTAS